MSELEVTEAQKRGCFFPNTQLNEFIKFVLCLADVTNTIDSEAKSDMQHPAQSEITCFVLEAFLKDNKKYIICLYINILYKTTDVLQQIH